MISNPLDLREIIRARIARTMIYLERYSKELPNYLMQVRHKLQHPLSDLNILNQELSSPVKLKSFPTPPLPEVGIPEEVNFLDLALNEIKTALKYFKQREFNEPFAEIQDYHFEQRLTRIIQQLEEIQTEIS
ncbi:MAG TPA: hypothetical protein VMV49_01135 [Candidatus Deferrimicrobium sp.]|nr:hypothetical protein [Candidatus Deferrimicrobium sp.]